jgi:hypothetical protein
MKVYASLLILLFSVNSFANTNNDVIKMCIGANETWAGASRCYHDWKVYDNRRKYSKEKQFLKDNPWYRGNNWDWEDRAEYRCEKIYSTQLLNNITVCHKPILIN